MNSEKSVNVLGTKYKIEYRNSNDDKELEYKCGYTCILTKLIVIRENLEGYSKKETKIKNRQTLRHELIHAFIYESGLNCENDWATNEEMTDYFAIQFEKMYKAFTEVGALENRER